MGKGVILGKNVRFADGVVVWNYVVIGDNTRIGDETRIGSFCDIGKNVIIGKNCNIQTHVTISNGCKIGNNVFIAPNSTLLNDKFPVSVRLTPPTIEDNAVIGGCVVILPSVTSRRRRSCRSWKRSDQERRAGDGGEGRSGKTDDDKERVRSQEEGLR